MSFELGVFIGVVGTIVLLVLGIILVALADAWHERLREERRRRISEGARRALIRRHGREGE